MCRVLSSIRVLECKVLYVEHRVSAEVAGLCNPHCKYLQRYALKTRAAVAAILQCPHNMSIWQQPDSRMTRLLKLNRVCHHRNLTQQQQLPRLLLLEVLERAEDVLACC